VVDAARIDREGAGADLGHVADGTVDHHAGNADRRRMVQRSAATARAMRRQPSSRFSIDVAIDSRWGSIGRAASR
jgi:hypothetical protein